jgi:hypothetical protein
MEIPIENVRRICAGQEKVCKDLLDRHANFVRNILRQDWDWWTANEGYEGVGKSGGSVHYAFKVCPDSFQIDKHICYEAEGFLQLVDDVPRYGEILLDEAGEAVYNRDWNTDMNKAIIKASQQMRDRNLHVQFNLPAIELLDSSLIRRFRTLVIYEAPKFVRGRSMWHVPVHQRYGSKKDPYWDLHFVYYFLDLPPSKRDLYRKVKTTLGRERLQGYIEQVQRDKEKTHDLDPLKVVDQISRMASKEKDKLRSTRGGYSRDLIRCEFKCSESLAKVIKARIESQERASQVA